MTHPRHTHAYITTASEWLDTRADLTCHWCHAWTSPDLPVGHDHKATVDHLVEVDIAPDIALNTALWVVACWPCNSARGARHVNRKRNRQPARQPSRRW